MVKILLTILLLLLPAVSDAFLKDLGRELENVIKNKVKEKTVDTINEVLTFPPPSSDNNYQPDRNQPETNNFEKEKPFEIHGKEKPFDIYGPFVNNPSDEIFSRKDKLRIKQIPFLGCIFTNEFNHSVVAVTSSNLAFLSNDSGKTWRPLATLESSSFCDQYVNSNASIILKGDKVSYNYGATFVPYKWPKGLVFFSSTFPNMVYIFDDNKLHLSQNYGKSFSSINLSVTVAGNRFNREYYAIDKFNPYKIYLYGFGAKDNRPSLFVLDLKNRQTVRANLKVTLNSLFRIAQDVTVPNKVYLYVKFGDKYKILKSNDGGYNFEPINSDFIPHSTELFATNGKIFVVYKGSVFVSEDEGNSFAPLNSEESMKVEKCSISNKNEILCISKGRMLKFNYTTKVFEPVNVPIAVTSISEGANFVHAYEGIFSLNHNSFLYDPYMRRVDKHFFYPEHQYTYDLIWETSDIKPVFNIYDFRLATKKISFSNFTVVYEGIFNDFSDEKSIKWAFFDYVKCIVGNTQISKEACYHVNDKYIYTFADFKYVKSHSYGEVYLKKYDHKLNYIETLKFILPKTNRVSYRFLRIVPELKTIFLDDKVSYDYGKTWLSAPFYIGNVSVKAFISDEDKIIVVKEEAVYIIDINKNSATQKNIQVTNVKRINKNHYIAISKDGKNVYETTDGGYNWKTYPGPFANINQEEVYKFTYKNGKLWVATSVGVISYDFKNTAN